MDADAKEPTAPTAAPTATSSPPAAPGAPRAADAAAPPVAGPRRPHRGVTYAILGGALLTMLAVLATHRPPRDVPPAGGGVPPTRVGAPPAPLAIAVDPPAPPAAPQASRPRVELVFALDTTGSMGSLIEGAKRKIWSLASFVAQGEPTPDLRVGLVAYRDVGEAYVTRVYDLDQDLDRVYRRLRAFRAEGGGDTPEHVARALDEAVRKMSWSQAPEVVKVIYLVGDAPPHTDYQDGYNYARAARAAAGKGIQLHTILCGEDPQAAEAWRKIASLGGGQFMVIPQDGGVREERSRYDDELATLHDRLTETTIGFGAMSGAVHAAKREAEAAPASVKAARATFMARAKEGKAIAGEGDLVDSVASGGVKLESIQGDLPAEMRGMDMPAQRALIASKQKERQELARRIDELGRLRKAELDAREAAPADKGAADGFDVAAKKALRRSVEANALAGLKL